KIVSYLSRDGDQNKYTSPYDKPVEQVISKKNAEEMKRMLIKTVNEGTGRSAKIPGLEKDGKKGTAKIGGENGYLKK
ncbi:penicillin-binding transpeptidase domain-containing protein, partial [Aliarcobacter butzleri]